MPNRNRPTAKVATPTPVLTAFVGALLIALALALPAVAHAQQMPGDQAAQAANGDSTCAQAANRAAHDPWLKVKHGDTAPLRADSKMRAKMAATAATEGHQLQCWHQLGLAQEMKRP
jgi:hypothetical protein